MKLSDGAQNFWSQIRNYTLASLTTIMVAFFIYGWKVASIITFFLFLCFLWMLGDIKEKLMRTLPNNFEYETANLEDYPLLNFTWFQQQAKELKLLGFVQIMDYQTVKKSGFARCFAHPEHYCYAEVNEVFKITGESYSRNTVITSSLDEGWTLSNINREVKTTDSIPYGFWRNPKNVRIYHPNISLEELLQKHLEKRQEMINNLAVILLTDISWENYVKKQEEAVIYRKKALKQKILLLAMIDVTKFEVNPQSEWLGDYPKFSR
jgi:hypothetical protein